jgi:hypothetical protein
MDSESNLVKFAGDDLDGVGTEPRGVPVFGRSSPWQGRHAMQGGRGRCMAFTGCCDAPGTSYRAAARSVLGIGREPSRHCGWTSAMGA